MYYYFFIYFFIFCMMLFIYKYSENILSYLNTQVSRIMPPKKSKKIVVFDLDETIGYFTEISIFWDALEKYYGHNLFADQFFIVLDTFPEFFRPNILKIFAFLHSKKKSKICSKLIIYTNNQGPKSWVKMISDYFDSRLGYKVFDHIIGAYKVNGKQIEPNRTSHEKSVTDLVSCSQIPANAEICFIDDLYHPLMDKDNVFYINIKPYRCSLTFEEMANRYYQQVLKGKGNGNGKGDGSDDADAEFVPFIVSYMKRYNYMVITKSEEEENTDKIVSKRLLSHLEDFLKREKNVNTHRKRNKRVKTMRQSLK